MSNLFAALLYKEMRKGGELEILGMAVKDL